ncbi:unnamed protein product [Urochloa humidicola]
MAGGGEEGVAVVRVTAASAVSGVRGWRSTRRPRRAARDWRSTWRMMRIRWRHWCCRWSGAARPGRTSGPGSPGVDCSSLLRHHHGPLPVLAASVAGRHLANLNIMGGTVLALEPSTVPS